MSMSANPFQVVRLQQPSTALAKNLTVNLGWRPAMVWVINYKAAGAMAIAVDGEDVAGGLTFGANASMAAATNGISFFDSGFKLGSHASLIRDDAAEVVCIAFRSLNPIAQVDLSDIEATPDAYGKGTQFGAKTEAGAETALGLADVAVTADP